MAKKILCVMVLMFALVGALASCGGDDSDTTTATVTTTGNPAHTHNYGEWETAKASTCTAEGTKERYCNCGEKQTSSIAKVSHTYDNLEG